MMKKLSFLNFFQKCLESSRIPSELSYESNSHVFGMFSGLTVARGGSTSFAGGNQVDGLPPVSSIELFKL